MKSGALAKIVGEFDSIETGGFPKSETRLGVTLRRTLEVNGTQSDLNGNRVTKGRGARQDAIRTKTVDVSSTGTITEGEERIEKVTEAADFMMVPGEYIVAESTKKDFVFSLVASATGTESRRYDVDIESLINAYPEANYWMGGIYGREGDINASDAYAEGDIFEDENFGEVFRESSKNRIGMQFEFEKESVKMLVTESGYVEVYRPSNFDTLQFSRLIEKVLMPHLV